MSFLKIYYLLVILSICNLIAVGQEMLEKYRCAEQFMERNVSKMAYNENVYHAFVAKSSNFWYINKSEEGYEYYMVVPEKRTNKRAFNHKILAKKLSQALDAEIAPLKLSLKNLEFNAAISEISFSINTSGFVYNLKKKQLSKITNDAGPDREIKSPDKKWIVFIKDYNVWIKNAESGETYQLSKDGTENYAYSLVYSNYYIKKEGKDTDGEREVVINWSPGSKHFIAPRYNTTNTKKLYRYKTTPEQGSSSELYSYNRTLAADLLTTMVDYTLFNVEDKSQANLNTRPNTPFLNSTIEWLPSGLKAYLLKYSRGCKSRKLVEINALTGEVKMLLNEESETYVDPLNHSFFLLEEIGLILWTSEKSGWNHIYLHDLETGTLLKQVTSGEFTVKDIIHINQQTGRILFAAFGMEKGYQFNQYLYSINFSGDLLYRITEENAYHFVYISPNKKYIVDVFSTEEQPTRMAVYKVRDGSKIMTVDRANIQKLKNIGYTNKGK